MRDGDQEVYTMNTDGSESTRLTNNPSMNHSPDFSPDSTKIVYSSVDHLYIMDADGRNKKRVRIGHRLATR